MTRTKSARLQLARGDTYALGENLIRRDGWFNTTRGNAIVSICRSHFHRLFPHLRLKPGEGPVDVEVTIRRVQVKKGKR